MINISKLKSLSNIIFDLKISEKNIFFPSERLLSNNFFWNNIIHLSIKNNNTNLIDDNSWRFKDPMANIAWRLWGQHMLQVGSVAMLATGLQPRHKETGQLPQVTCCPVFFPPLEESLCIFEARMIWQPGS